MLSKMRFVLPTLVLIVSVCWALEVGEVEQLVFGQPDAASLGAASNLSDVGFSFNSRDLLAPRQACYAPNGWCSNTGRCCPPDYFKCCQGGCGRTEDGACCGQGTCKSETPLCCWNNLCIGYQDECCSTQGWACPAPFHCVLYQGQQGCCTDLKCTVYLGTSGTTVTRTANPVVPQTRTINITPPPPERTTAAGGGETTVIVGGDYTIYYTTYYWTYWYYYYTFYYYAALQTTTTTRTITTITETTTLTCSATDSADADSIFEASSDDLPTPSDANSIIPAEPTAGAIILGNCTTASTTGSRTTVCQTETARSGSSSRARSTSSATSSFIAGGGGGEGAGATLRVPMVLCGLVVLGALLVVQL